MLKVTYTYMNGFRLVYFSAHKLSFQDTSLQARQNELPWTYKMLVPRRGRLIIIALTVDKLILTARQKLTVLIQAVSKMEVTPEVKQNANIFYHNILARSMRDNYKDEVVAEGGNFFVYTILISQE